MYKVVYFLYLLISHKNIFNDFNNSQKPGRKYCKTRSLFLVSIEHIKKYFMEEISAVSLYFNLKPHKSL